jgi:hypothetical protein
VEAVVAGASSEVDGDSSAVLLGLCHEGIDVDLDVSSGMMRYPRYLPEIRESEGVGRE